jgi:hypothetical protein
MPLAPKRLRNAHQHALTRGEDQIEPSRAEERTMDEVVGDGVFVPPDANGNHRCGRHRKDHRAVQRGEGDKQPIPTCCHGVTG